MTDAASAKRPLDDMLGGDADDAAPLAKQPRTLDDAPTAPAAPRILARAWTGDNEFLARVSVEGGNVVIAGVDIRTTCDDEGRVIETLEVPTGAPTLIPLATLRRTISTPDYLRLHSPDVLATLSVTPAEVTLLPRHYDEIKAYGEEEYKRLCAERPLVVGCSSAQAERREASIRVSRRQAEAAYTEQRRAELADLQRECIRRLIMGAAPPEVRHPTLPADAKTFAARYNGRIYPFAVAVDPPTLMVEMGAQAPVFTACDLSKPGVRGLIIAAPNLHAESDSEDDGDDANAAFLLFCDSTPPLVLSRMSGDDANVLAIELDRHLELPTIVAGVGEPVVAAADLSVLVDIEEALESYGRGMDGARPDHLLLAALKVVDGNAADAAIDEAALESGDESVYNDGGEGEDSADSYSELDIEDIHKELNEL